MVAKGRFGGDLFKGFLQVDLDIPFNIRLRLDSERVSRFVGNRVARNIRRRLRRGEDGDGRPLTVGEDGERPAVDSGSFIRSIRFDRSTATVRPSTRIRKDKRGGQRVPSNFAIAAVHIASGQWRDPLGSNDQRQIDKVSEWATEAIATELDRGRAGLVSELRRIRRRGRR